MTTKSSATVESKPTAAQIGVKHPSVTQHSTTFTVPVERERSVWPELAAFTLGQLVIVSGFFLLMQGQGLSDFVQKCCLHGTVGL